MQVVKSKSFFVGIKTLKLSSLQKILRLISESKALIIPFYPGV